MKPARSVNTFQNPSVISDSKFLARRSHAQVAETSSSLRQAANDETPKSGGIEPKYLGALGVFIFAALYDFFITHGGQPYLAHPPSL